MSTTCLKQSLRSHGGPTIFLTTICLIFGVLFLALGAAVGAVFIAAGIGAFTMFALLGARENSTQRR